MLETQAPALQSVLFADTTASVNRGLRLRVKSASKTAPVFALTVSLKDVLRLHTSCALISWFFGCGKLLVDRVLARSNLARGDDVALTGSSSCDSNYVSLRPHRRTWDSCGLSDAW